MTLPLPSECDAMFPADDWLATFVSSRGGAVTTRHVIAGIRSIADAKAAAAALQRLVDAGRGSWVNKPTTEKGGRPTRLFVLQGDAPSAQPLKLAVKQGSADADTRRQPEPGPEMEQPAP